MCVCVCVCVCVCACTRACVRVYARARSCVFVFARGVCDNCLFKCVVSCKYIVAFFVVCNCAPLTASFCDGISAPYKYSYYY